MGFEIVLLASLFGFAEKPTSAVDAAHEHFQRGRYAEAVEAYEELTDSKDPKTQLAVALGLSDVHEAVGRWEDATDVITTAIESFPKNADLVARLAELQFRRGDYTEAEKTARDALKLDGDHLRARLVLTDTLAETGRIKEALDGYVWFVRYYNRAQPKTAEDLLLVARGSLQYARWKSSSQIFRFIINTLCPDALKDDPNSWQAMHLSGDVLLEKYNRAQALPEFQAALAINPRAADVLASQAGAAFQKHQMEKLSELIEQVLKINPQHVGALQLQADYQLQAGDLDAAKKAIDSALEVNPHDQRTLARLAALYLIQDGPPADETLAELLTRLDAIDQIDIAKPDRFTKLVQELAKRNPHPGPFLNVLGETMEGRRKFDLAEKFYRQAMVSMPELSTPKTNLGLLAMRTGQNDSAREILNDAFQADPFHVRVSNMRKVLKLLDGYETISTDHFVIRVDSQADKILGRYMAEYLESIYPELTKQFDFEPPGRTIFEIFHNSKGLSGHQWFSARMVGLPWIQTVGASTGMIVALTSPTAGEKSFDWARVLKHEYVHIITLQQTQFNIPHWFTEALAVTSENIPRPEEWNRLLAERVPQGDIRSLKNLNDGFIRPESPADWQFAYCQSKLYAEYMTKQFGADTIPKLLDAYRRNLPTEKAIPEVFEIPLDEFEAGYRKYLDEIVQDIQGHRPQEESKSLAEVEKEYQADSENPAKMAAYAAALVEIRKLNEAEELATKALTKNPQQPQAGLVLATLAVRSRDFDAAATHLEAVLDRDDPHPKVLELLAKLKFALKKNAEAAELYELGREKFPYDLTWLKGQAAAYLRMEDRPNLRTALEELARYDTDNASVRQKLASMAFEDQDFEDAIRHGMAALHIDVMDIETHEILGQSYLHQKAAKNAIREYEVLMELVPTDANRLGLAKAYQLANRTDDARKLVEKVLASDPENQDAKTLADELNSTKEQN